MSVFTVLETQGILFVCLFVCLFVFSPSAGPGFPGFPLPPFTQGGSAPPTSSADQGTGGQSTGQSANQGATPTQEAGSTGVRGGLFKVGGNDDGNDNSSEQQVESSSSEEQGLGSKVLPAWAEEQGEGSSSSSSSGGGSSDGGLSSASSSSHVDSDIRQRRLARLHSQPSVTQQSLSPLLEREGEERADNRRTEASSGGETKV